MEQTDSSKNNLDGFLESFSSRRDYYIKNYRKFLDEPFLKEHFEQKEELRKNYLEPWEKSFNIFKITNPKNNHHERLHSDLIMALLDPATPDISDKGNGYLKILIDLLADKNNSVMRYYFPNGYKIEAEEQVDAGERGRIDILINDRNHAIIIENKSNNAYDTSNQLAKYYTHVKDNLQLEVLAIVYLPLDPLKKPPSVYADEYKRYESDINKKTVILPVIAAEGKDDFVHGFLSKCLTHAVTRGNILAAIYLNQMIKLFKFLGGNNMASGIDKELFIELFKSHESISMAKDIADIYYRKDEYITAVFMDSFIPKLIEKNFETFENSTAYGTKIAGDIYAVFYCDIYYKAKGFAFGFYSPKEIPEKTSKLLNKLLDEPECSRHLYEAAGFSANWAVKHVNLMDRGEIPAEEIIDYFTKMLLEKHAALFEKAAKALREQGE